MKRFLQFSFVLFLILSFKNVALAQDYWRHYDVPYSLSLISQVDSTHIVIAGGGSVIYKTINGGESWFNIHEYKNESGRSLRIRDIAYPAQNLIIAIADSIRNINPPGQNNKFGFSACILRSEDGGQTWEQQNFGVISDTDSRVFTQIIMNDANNGIIAQNWRDTTRTQKLSPILFTTDGGKTWNEPNTQFENFGITILDYLPVEHHISSPSPGNWFVHGRDYKNQRNVLWHSSDYGKTWMLGSSPIELTNKIQFLDSLTGFAIGTKTSQRIPVFAKTVDGGENWMPIEVVPEIPLTGLSDFDFYDEMNGMLAQNDKIFRTSDGGNTWNTQVTGLMDITGKRGTGLIRVIFKNLNHAVGSTRDGIFLKYIPMGILAQPHLTSPRIISSAGLPAIIFPIPGEVKWDAVPGADKYYIATKGGEFPGVTLPTIFDSTNTNSYTIQSLPPINAPGHLKNTYNVRVRAVSLNSLSNWSVAVPFRFESAVSVNENPLLNFNNPYPNPAHNFIYIPFKTTNESEISIMISDALGKSINTYQSSYSQSHNAIILSDLELLPNGIYFVQISQGNHSQTSMITISK